jgi:hypothetical protein
MVEPVNNLKKLDLTSEKLRVASVKHGGLPCQKVGSNHQKFNPSENLDVTW